MSLGNLPKGTLVLKGEEGGGVLGRRDTKQALGRLHPGPGRDPALSPPDVDRNVLPHPSVLLVVLLNVSLNTLPVLAFRVIYQALKQLRPKVRVARAPTAECWKRGLQGDVEQGLGSWRPRHTFCALEGVWHITGPRT